jgi:hypothetical protein
MPGSLSSNRLDTIAVRPAHTSPTNVEELGKAQSQNWLLVLVS